MGARPSPQERTRPVSRTAIEPSKPLISFLRISLISDGRMSAMVDSIRLLPSGAAPPPALLPGCRHRFFLQARRPRRPAMNCRPGLSEEFSFEQSLRARRPPVRLLRRKAASRKSTLLAPDPGFRLPDRDMHQLSP